MYVNVPNYKTTQSCAWDNQLVLLILVEILAPTHMTEQLAESGLIWNCHHCLLNAVCERGGNMAACGLSQSITRHWELCAQGCRSQSSLFSLCLCVGVCGLHACVGSDHDIESVPSVSPSSPPFSESCLCNWSQTGHLSCQQRFISFLSFRQALYCFQMEKVLQGSSLFFEKKM